MDGDDFVLLDAGVKQRRFRFIDYAKRARVHVLRLGEIADRRPLHLENRRRRITRRQHMLIERLITLNRTKIVCRLDQEDQMPR